MLVLTRKVGEALLIGENVRVYVVRVGPGSVRIGVEAPDGVNIVREELLPSVKVSFDDAAPDQLPNAGF